MNDRFDNEGTDFHALQKKPDRNAAKPVDYDVAKAAALERKKKKQNTDFQSLKRTMPKWTRSTVQRTFTDYVVDFATPFLIFAMVLSIVFFLLDVRFIFTEKNSGAIRGVAFCIVMGVVALNRLVARDGTEESMIYIAGLMGMTAFATLVFSTGYDTGSLAGNLMAGHPVIFNVVIVGILWWATNRLTHECCVDEKSLAGDVGIITGTLQSFQAAVKRREDARAIPKKKKKKVGQRTADHILERMEIEAYDPNDWRPEDKKKTTDQVIRPSQRMKRRHPGISILFFAIPAMAVFALGLPVLMQGGSFHVASGHAYVALYTFASLMLLMMTSLGGLRQYFRSRNVAFAPGIAIFWMGLGFFMVLTVMFGAVATPKPDMPRAAHIEERELDPYKKGTSLKLQFPMATASEAVGQGVAVRRVGYVVLGGMVLFMMFAALRVLGNFVAGVGSNRDWYPERVVHFFNGLDEFLKRIIRVPELPDWMPRPPRRISSKVSGSIHFQNPMKGEGVIQDDVQKVRDYVALTFDALCALAMDLGVARDPEDTPFEFLEKLPRELKGLRPEAKEITEIYVRSEYSQELPPERVLDRLRRFWLAYERIRSRHVK